MLAAENDLMTIVLQASRIDATWSWDLHIALPLKDRITVSQRLLLLYT